MYSFSHCIFPIFPIFPNTSHIFQYTPYVPLVLFYPATFEEKPSLSWGNAPRSSRCPVGTRACDCSRCNLGHHWVIIWTSSGLDSPIPKCCPFDTPQRTSKCSLCDILLFNVLVALTCQHAFVCIYVCMYVYIYIYLIYMCVCLRASFNVKNMYNVYIYIYNHVIA